ncbi:uncharacterized protein LOC131622107 [Vicia villosa]|uniref:uncharacterized protein LOC131622107 n=1 Tax=Vicia villosa TaxID=3911 RepID=UPI00273B6762|nr:uncharacterized protein LOC131622107 [Vicia villosa]
MGQNHYQWGSERAPSERTSGEKSSMKSGMYEISSLDRVNAKVDALTQKLKNLTVALVAVVAAVAPNCEICGMSGHASPEFHLLAGVSPKPVNYAQGNPYSNTHNPRWNNHPNFTNKDFLNQNVHTNEQIKQLETKVDALATHNKMLETQISQVAQQQAPTAAPAGTFSGQPQPNLKGHAHAIILRSGKEMDEPTDPRLKNPAMFQSPCKTTEEESGPNDKSSNPKEKEDKEGETEEKEASYLNITIPFTEAITQMPSYAKFLKEILSNKKKIEDNETVTPTTECSAIIQNKMPPKLKDPGSFSIPCNIGKFVIDKALCDLGSSIRIMPLSICEKLNMGELRPTKMSVQLADRSVKYLVGVLENVSVRIGQFYIPTDFIIMDIKEDVNTPIILG